MATELALGVGAEWGAGLQAAAAASAAANASSASGSNSLSAGDYGDRSSRSHSPLGLTGPGVSAALDTVEGGLPSGIGGGNAGNNGSSSNNNNSNSGGNTQKHLLLSPNPPMRDGSSLNNVQRSPGGSIVSTSSNNGATGGAASGNSAGSNGPPANINENEKVYWLIVELLNPQSREAALLELSKKREQWDDLALVLWHSFGESLIREPV